MFQSQSENNCFKNRKTSKYFKREREREGGVGRERESCLPAPLGCGSDGFARTRSFAHLVVIIRSSSGSSCSDVTGPGTGAEPLCPRRFQPPSELQGPPDLGGAPFLLCRAPPDGSLAPGLIAPGSPRLLLDVNSLTSALASGEGCAFSASPPFCVMTSSYAHVMDRQAAISNRLESPITANLDTLQAKKNFSVSHLLDLEDAAEMVGTQADESVGEAGRSMLESPGLTSGSDTTQQESKCAQMEMEACVISSERPAVLHRSFDDDDGGGHCQPYESSSGVINNSAVTLHVSSAEKEKHHNKSENV